MTTRRCAFESFAGFEKRPQPTADASATMRNATRKIRFIAHSEDEPQLQLERPRLVYVCERGDRVRRRACRDELAEGRVGRQHIAVNGLRASEDVRVVEDVEGFEAKQDARALGRSDAVLDEERNVRGRRAAEGRLADDLSVDNWPVVVQAVAVIVNAGRRVERSRGGELRESADGEVVRRSEER